MKSVNAIYPGSFDPITFGHIDIITRGLKLFDKVIIAVTDASPKNALFSVQERVDLIKESLPHNERVEVCNFKGLLVNFAQDMGAQTILRGLRSVSDFEYELRMDHANRTLDANLETCFFMTERMYSHLSSSIIKEIARLGGPCEHMVPSPVCQALKNKFGE